MRLIDIENLEKEIEDTQREFKIKTILFLDYAQLCDPDDPNDEATKLFIEIDNEITAIKAKLAALQEEYEYIRTLWIGCI